MLFCRSPRRLFYFRAHLKDFSVTLIRAEVNTRQCVLSVQRSVLYTGNDLLGKNSIYICCRNLLPDLTSLCHIIICPPESNTFSLCQAWSPPPSHTHTHTFTGPSDVGAHMLMHTNKHTSRCWVLLSVTAENQTAHPSACVIPSNQSYVAMVKTSPHELVNQTATAQCFSSFCFCLCFFHKPHLNICNLLLLYL